MKTHLSFGLSCLLLTSLSFADDFTAKPAAPITPKPPRMSQVVIQQTCDAYANRHLEQNNRNMLARCNLEPVEEWWGVYEDYYRYCERHMNGELINAPMPARVLFAYLDSRDRELNACYANKIH